MTAGATSVFTPVAYDTRRLPIWPYSQHVANAQPATSDVDTGYDTNATRLSGLRRDVAMRHANATLCDKDFFFPMFVSDLSIDTALAGSTAQSRLTRDFYPKNFVQPSFRIAGQSLDQRDYGMLCEFVHQAQRKAMLNGWSNLTQLVVNGWGIDGTRKSGPHVRRSGQDAQFNQLVRGSHHTIIAQGYVTSIPRTHQKGVYAPEWDFGFVVVAMLQGPYRENLATAQAQKTWVDLLKGVQTLKVNSALLNENKKNLAWVTANSANIINDPGPVDASIFGTGGGGGGGGGTSSPSSTVLAGPNVPRGTGKAFKVVASQESDNLASNSGGSAYGLPLDGYSELMNNSGLGHLPGGTKMYIAANNKSILAAKCDNGAGSSFNPVMGLYPRVSEYLFGTRSGGSFEVIIWLADGSTVHPTNGTPI